MPRIHLGCGGQVRGTPGCHELEKDWINVDICFDEQIWKRDWANEEIADGFKRVLQADFCALPFPSDFAEEFYSNHSLEHVSQNQVPKVLAEQYRVLKPGGRIGICVPDLLGIAKKLVETDGNMLWSDRGERLGDFPGGYTKLLVGIYGEDWSGPFAFHKTGFTPRYLGDLLREAGFRDIEIKQIWAMEIFSLDATAIK